MSYIQLVLFIEMELDVKYVHNEKKLPVIRLNKSNKCSTGQL